MRIRNCRMRVFVSVSCPVNDFKAKGIKEVRYISNTKKENKEVISRHKTYCLYGKQLIDRQVSRTNAVQAFVLLTTSTSGSSSALLASGSIFLLFRLRVLLVLTASFAARFARASLIF